MPKPKYHIVVCTNARPPGHPKPSCGSAGSASLLMAFNIGLMQKGVTPGETVVTDGQLRLYPGARIEPVAAGKIDAPL